jgi:hypothetical protein
VRVVRAFLGLTGYYRHFICDYGSIAAPLTKLLCKDAFKWSTEAESMFRALQQALTVVQEWGACALNRNGTQRAPNARECSMIRQVPR